MNKQLILIPRVESKAPNKNTIDWEIPDKVIATLMLIERVGYMFIVKVRVREKSLFSSGWKTFSKISSDAATASFAGMDYLEKFGYGLDPDSVKFGEQIGAEDYFKKNSSKVNENDINLEPLISRAETLFLKKAYEEAIEFYDQVLSIDPTNIRALFGKGKAEGNLGKRQIANEMYDRVLKINSTNDDAIDAYYLKGHIFSVLGQHEEAINMCDKVLKLNPKDDEAITLKGFIFNKTGQYDLAIKMFDEALVINKKNSVALGQKKIAMNNLKNL